MQDNLIVRCRIDRSLFIVVVVVVVDLGITIESKKTLLTRERVLATSSVSKSVTMHTRGTTATTTLSIQISSQTRRRGSKSIQAMGSALATSTTIEEKRMRPCISNSGSTIKTK